MILYDCLVLNFILGTQNLFLLILHKVKHKVIVEYHNSKEESTAVFSLNIQWSDMKVSELKAVVNWEKLKTDKSVPGGKVNLQ